MYKPNDERCIHVYRWSEAGRCLVVVVVVELPEADHWWLASFKAVDRRQMITNALAREYIKQTLVCSQHLLSPTCVCVCVCVCVCIVLELCPWLFKVN